MNQRCIDDWCMLGGAKVEIRLQGSVVSSGIVETVTGDGNVLWLHSPIEGRRLFDKAEAHEAWASEDGAGFYYRVSRGALGT